MAVERGAQVVLLSGDAGIGKSTLTVEFLERLSASGWGTHVGHCIEYGDRPVPFGPIVAVLRSVLLDNLDHLDQLVRHHRDDLSGLLPELVPDGLSSSSLAGDVDRLFDAITSLLTEASARRPLVAVIEDIHWADAASRDLLASLVHSLGSARVLLLVTERSGALARAHPLRVWLAEQRRLPTVHSLALVGLAGGEMAEQAEGVLGYTPDAAMVEELLARTGGNPYFAHELLLARRDGNEALPTSLVEFLTSRIEGLGEDQRQVLRALAVAGGSVGHSMLSAMVPDVDVGVVTRALFEASILLVEGSEYRFGHALLREAILADVLPFESEELHRRAAEAMEAEPGRESPLAHSVSLALHWGRANDPDASLVSAAGAAEAAAVVAAYETAAEMAVQALGAWHRAVEPEAKLGIPRSHLLLKAAEWLVNCYRGSDASDLINEALGDWAAQLPTGQRALLLAQLAPIEFHLGNPSVAAELLAEAEQLVGDELSPEAAQVHHRVSKQAVADGHIHPALEAAERATAIAEKYGPRVVLIEALTTKALATGITDDRERGVALAREARDLALADGLVSQVANTHRTEMLIYLFRDGRPQHCLDASRQGLAYAEQHCGPRWRAEFRQDLCLGYVEAGRFNEAVPLIEELMATKLDDLRRLTVLQAAGMHALGRGALDEAQTFLAEANSVADRYQSAQETGFQARLLAELARRQGDLGGALTLIDDALSLQLPSDNLTYTRESIVEKIRIVRAWAARGRDDLADQVELLTRDFDGVGTANVAMKALMELELATLRSSADLGKATRTAELLESAGFLYEGAHARLLAVDLALSSDKRNGADIQARLTELSEIAAEHGMAAIGETVSALAKAAKVKLATVTLVPERPKPVDALPHHLTAREVEVMSLLAEGLTNKAIGLELYVSPRTISTHISNLLAKLAVSTRGEAAAAYHRLGLHEITQQRESVDAQ